MQTNFYCLVGYDRVKNYPLWLKSVSIPDQHPLYPRCIPDAPTPKPAHPDLPRPSGWPIPALYDQPPTYSWCNYAQYAQYGTNPRTHFHSRPQMKCYANRQCYVGSVPKMHTWPILLIKSDWKWCIHLSRFTMTLRTVMVQYTGIQFCLVVCNFDDFVDRLVYFDRNYYRIY